LPILLAGVLAGATLELCASTSLSDLWPPRWWLAHDGVACAEAWVGVAIADAAMTQVPEFASRTKPRRIIDMYG
jgi:hypothetical protein